MKKAVIVLSLSVAFLVGCLTATVATQLIVPPAHAGTNPQRWEYAVADARVQHDVIRAVQELNKFGAQGWELIAVEGAGHYFKRPLP